MAKSTEFINRARFWALVDTRTDAECWPWLGKLDRCGYGEYIANHVSVRYSWRAHRLSYDFLVESIPPGLVIDHLCRNRTCQNPKHMEPVTAVVNNQRGMRSLINGQRVCKRGHVVAGDNAAPHPQHPHLVICRACIKLTSNRHTIESDTHQGERDEASLRGGRHSSPVGQLVLHDRWLYLA